MKIVRIIARLNIGGPAHQAVGLTATMRADGHTCWLLTGKVPQGEGDGSYLAAERGITPQWVPGLSRRVALLSDVRAFWYIWRLLRREKPDLVHTHTAKAGALGRLAAWLSGIPSVHTFHGHVFHAYFSPARTAVFLRIERFLARRSARIIAISESQRRDLCERYRVAAPDKMRVVRLGFDLRPFVEVAGERPAQLPGRLRVGWVGRFTAVKDPLLFCEIAGYCHAEGIAAEFTMVGGGELLAAVEHKLAQTGAPCRLQGWQRDMGQVYRQLDVLVLTSYNEGTPVAIIEAMAAGCQVIAVDCGGVGDLLGPADPGAAASSAYVECAYGYRVKSRSPATFAAALGDLATRPVAAAARQRRVAAMAATDFDQDRLCRDLYTVYEEVLQGSSG